MHSLDDCPSLNLAISAGFSTVFCFLGLPLLGSGVMLLVVVAQRTRLATFGTENELHLLDKTYLSGVKLTKKAFRPIAKRFHRSDILRSLFTQTGGSEFLEECLKLRRLDEVS